MSGRPAIEPPPAPDHARPALLRREFAGVAFPNCTKEFGWRAAGARRGTIEGRGVDTVSYTHRGHRIAYTVVSGAPLDPPADAAAVRHAGVELHRFRDDGRDVVMFERGGRTCVLAGRVIHRDTLAKLAAWQADGAIAL
jgi:hypothetical protein